MTYRVIITGPAERDLFQIMAWWSEHRSAVQAERWFSKIVPTIDTLAEQPQRCPHSPETNLLPTGLRQLHFGLRHHPTHRIVFTIVDQEVRILRIRHTAQADLTLEDIG